VGLLLTKEDILSKDDIKTKIIRVPGWGGKVKVRGLNASERDELEMKTISNKMTNQSAWIASKCVIDNESVQVFSIADIVGLGKKSAPCLQLVASAALSLSGFSKEALDELEKP